MTRGDDVAQSSGPTEPMWDWSAPLPWPAGQGLAYYRNPFHARVKGGRWSRSVMPKVYEGREGWPANHVYGRLAVQVIQIASSMRWRSSSPPINTPHFPPCRRCEESEV
jgi:hypothetical protein